MLTSEANNMEASIEGERTNTIIMGYYSWLFSDSLDHDLWKGSDTVGSRE